METFKGAPFVSGGGAGASTTATGFAAFYAAASLFYPHDMHFANLVFDVWGLYDLDKRAAQAAQAGLPGSPSAGKSTQGYTAPPSSQGRAFTASQTVTQPPWAQQAGGDYRRGSVQQQQQRIGTPPFRGGDTGLGAGGRVRR
jgi:hypothetical protein